MMVKKYGKSFDDIFNIKQGFFLNNDTLLKGNLRLAELYKKQPKRKNCKNCNKELSTQVFFYKHDVEYFLCENCSHLNGGYEDTQEYVRAVYVDEITDYSKNYNEKNTKSYLERVQKIYKPKVDFLIECLIKDSQSIENLSLYDIGAGSGYFLYALKEYGFGKLNGYEVSKKQVELANFMLGEGSVKEVHITDLQNIIREGTPKIISMVGVLEHLTNPREVLGQLKQNNHIEYVYLSLPLFSFSVYFELFNQDNFNRHLSGGHTHLYTRESIFYFCKEFGFEVIGEWQFGTDIMDLFRFFVQNMKKQEMHSKSMDYFLEKFKPLLDDLQLVCDKSGFSSEIHVLLKKTK